MLKIEEDVAIVLPADKKALARGNVEFIRYELNELLRVPAPPEALTVVLDVSRNFPAARMSPHSGNTGSVRVAANGSLLVIFSPANAWPPKRTHAVQRSLPERNIRLSWLYH